MAVTRTSARARIRLVRRSHLRSGAVLAAAGLGVAVTAAAEWTFEPAAELRTVATDNVQLQGDGEEQSDLVGVLNPSFSLRREDDTLNIGLDYSLEAVGYLETDGANQIFQQINGGLDASLLGDHLLINLGGALFQQVADPSNPFINNNVAVTGNRTDTVNLDGTVTWQQSFGDFADFSVSHSESRFDFDLPQLIDTDASSSNFRLANPESGQGITWSLTGSLDRIEFSNDIPEAEFSTLLAEVGYWATPNLRAFVNSGVESDFLEHRSEIDYDTFIWTAGFDWSVADRDQLTVSYGRRVFGGNFNFSWLHRLGEKLEVSVDYQESPSTNPQSARLQIRSFADRESLEALSNLVGLDRPSSADSFVRRRLTAGIRADGNRLDFGVSAYYERRTDRVNPLGLELDVDDEEAEGGRAYVRWDVGVRTQLNADINWEQAQFLGAGEVERFTTALGVDYSLGSNTDITFEYRYFDGGSPTQGFIENRLTLTLGRRFQ
ncbi:MAG: TIGR03016 family PEP-CTERM system-associated outer membrane protein [Pseudomonadota bacterium]